MRVFVTGGTGLLGNSILRQLEQAGHETVALVRREPESRVFGGLLTEPVIGDLSSVDAIDRTIRHSDAVIHCAGLIHLGWKRLAESMRVNADGTRSIVDACIAHDRKLVHVGTVDAVAIGSRSAPSNETTPIDETNSQIPCNYVVSKRAGVDEVISGVQRGLRAAIVHPGFMLGPWDWKPSSGRMILEVGKAWRPFAPRGGCCVCDSRNVASAAITAIEKGGDSGRAFILGGHNITYLQLWREIASRMGTRVPIARTGPIALWVAGQVGDLSARITGNEGDINSAIVRMSSLFHWHDSSRAEAELDYKIGDLSRTLDDAVAWVRKHHSLS
ncbi:dTDP-glucose 4,6-dehydratase [Planctomycetes bacterium CA13]|uniref:dTDP-glucose 4,6-dehydratase n=1 Tax=Novipirellula herctigrandis TaxID=2527986 RepID=A0A5C5YNP6_9BACT|nr:dTDP-glucose 4,6-dehydratase [Planctomycetes bacterium CA13]